MSTKLDNFLSDKNLNKPDDLKVACYTFPNYHRSAINDKLYGPGWTEYVLARGGLPWFEGHHQPRTPLLGELDERQPATWEKYIDIAVSHGINVFIWDSYWFDNQPVLHEALDEGFLGCPSNRKMDFAVMWTNHHLPLFFPTMNTDGSNNLITVHEGPVRKVDVWRSMSYLISRYLHQPNYWRIDGEPVMVLWNVPWLIREFGKTGTRDLLDELREFAGKLGHKGLHFHATGQSRSVFADLDECGVNSYGRYNCLPEASVRLDFGDRLADYESCVFETVSNIWPENNDVSSLPFFPAINIGWDTSPRRCPPPCREPGVEDGDIVWPAVITGETPALFKQYAQAAVSFLNSQQTKVPVLTIGCWNEWTEGQYMLPDTRFGSGMIKALSEALGIKGSPDRLLSSGQLLG
jgi:hypothetical protein